MIKFVSILILLFLFASCNYKLHEIYNSDNRTLVFKRDNTFSYNECKTGKMEYSEGSFFRHDNNVTIDSKIKSNYIPFTIKDTIDTISDFFYLQIIGADSSVYNWEHPTMEYYRPLRYYIDSVVLMVNSKRKTLMSPIITIFDTSKIKKIDVEFFISEDAPANYSSYKFTGFANTNTKKIIIDWNVNYLFHKDIKDIKIRIRKNSILWNNLFFFSSNTRNCQYPNVPTPTVR